MAYLHAILQPPLVLPQHSLKTITLIVPTVFIALSVVSMEEVDHRCFWNARLELKDVQPLRFRFCNDAGSFALRNRSTGRASLL